MGKGEATENRKRAMRMQRRLKKTTLTRGERRMMARFAVKDERSPHFGTRWPDAFQAQYKFGA